MHLYWAWGSYAAKARRSSRRSYKSTHFLPLLTFPQQICQRYCLIPARAAAIFQHLQSVCSPTGAKMSNHISMVVFVYARAWVSVCHIHALKALWCVKAKPSANYNLNSSISSEQADSAVQMSPGHYHRLSCSSKPEVTTAPSVCRACTVPSKAYG